MGAMVKYYQNNTPISIELGILKDRLMVTLVPIASIQQSLKHLISLDTVNHLANVLSEEIVNRFNWMPELAQENSTQLSHALQASLRTLSEQATQEYITQEELHELLNNSSDPTWLDVLNYINTLQISLTDMAKLCISLREAIFELLKDADLLGVGELHLFTLFFDWVLHQVYGIWREESRLNPTSNSIQTFDITSLRAIAESVRSPVELNPVLQSIVERVRESGLWPMCAIGIIDPNDQEIQVPAQSGFSESYPADIKFPADGSATLASIHRKSPIAINDVYADHEFPVLHEAATAAGYRSILLVPIFIDEMRAAMAFCSDEPHEYIEDEITLANAIAQQVMIAIENAQQHQREKQRGDELESLNQLIAEQNQLLQGAISTHTTLTKLVLDGSGLERILEEVRGILGNPVAIEDAQFNLLAFSQDWDYFDQHRLDSIMSGGTAQTLFDNPELANALDDLHNHRRALLMPILPSVGIEKRRIVAPIIVGTETLGYVWVMEGLRPFNDLHDRITTEQAALIFALEMMKQRAAYETELRLKADFLSDLFSETGGKESDLVQRARFLGLNLNKSTLLLVVDIVSDIWKGLDTLQIQEHNRRIILTIQSIVSEQTHQEHLVANQSGRIVIIVSSTTNKSSQSKMASDLAQLIREAIKQMYTNVNVLIGVGQIAEDIWGIRQSFQQASRAIDAAKSLGRRNETLGLRDLGIYGILFREGESNELVGFAKDSLFPLIEYDSQNGTELLKTLNTYLNNQVKLAETSRELYIHVNTLRQRIERIEFILDISLKDSYIVLNLQLALRVYELLPEHRRFK